MSQDRHSPEYQNNKFCARVPCEHNDYIKICKPSWDSFTFAQKGSGGGAFKKKYEAHHILCWSPVAGILFSDPAKPILKGTEWCVNNKTNMVALPLWGHTVQWYLSSDLPPPFANLPQHDWDHNCKRGYTDEVRDKLKELVQSVKDAVDEHDMPSPEDIKGLLDSASDEFRAKLQARGIRQGGTHSAWSLGQDKPTSEWYMPFSMASEAVARCAIHFGKEKNRKLEQIRAAAALLSNG